MTVPLSRDELAPRIKHDTPVYGRCCHLCGGRLEVLVRVEPQVNGQPVTYYACERCAHVLVRNH